MADNLLELAIATTGGYELWKTLPGLRIDSSIGGPIWAMKGWPPAKTSLLFASYDNPDIAAVGQELDALLVGLIELLGGEVPNQLGNHVD